MTTTFSLTSIPPTSRYRSRQILLVWRQKNTLTTTTQMKTKNNALMANYVGSNSILAIEIILIIDWCYILPKMYCKHGALGGLACGLGASIISIDLIRCQDLGCRHVV